jgi:transcriptional regulator with XRE-family HTH domain
MATPTHDPGFASNLRAARDERGISQERLSELAGLNWATVYRLEASEREPRLSTILSLARALGMSGSDLIRGL